MLMERRSNGRFSVAHCLQRRSLGAGRQMLQQARHRSSQMPGKFKEELCGTVIYALDAMMYVCGKDDKMKWE